MFEARMKRCLCFLVLACIICVPKGFTQTGFGVRGGLIQSVPLQFRDSFSGAPMPLLGINVYQPLDKRWSVAAGLRYAPVKLSNKWDASGLKWETLAISAGTEYLLGRERKTAWYNGLTAQYVLGFGKNVLSPNTQSGTEFVSQKIDGKLIPSFETGLTFRPKPLIRLNISAVQPLMAKGRNDHYPVPSMVQISIEYRINTRQIKEMVRDTFNEERAFTRRLKGGTLYFVEDRTDSSHRIYRDTLKKYYGFSKVDFISKQDFNHMLDAFAQSPDSLFIFIARAGSIVYSVGRPATYGIMLYDYAMRHPVRDKPFFVRNLTGDLEFEDPALARRLIKSLNGRLNKLYYMYH